MQYKKTKYKKGVSFFQGVRAFNTWPTSVFADAGAGDGSTTETLVNIASQATPSSDNKKVVIPATITIQGSKYRVTEVGVSLYSNNKNITQLIIGKNVTKIMKQSFMNCSKLETITILSKKLKKVGSKAFEGIKKKAIIYVPSKKCKTAYKKLFKAYDYKIEITK